VQHIHAFEAQLSRPAVASLQAPIAMDSRGSQPSQLWSPDWHGMLQEHLQHAMQLANMAKVGCCGVNLAHGEHASLADCLARLPVYLRTTLLA
jgi:hypothetical protein